MGDVMQKICNFLMSLAFFSISFSHQKFVGKFIVTMLNSKALNDGGCCLFMCDMKSEVHAFFMLIAICDKYVNVSVYM